MVSLVVGREETSCGLVVVGIHVWRVCAGPFEEQCPLLRVLKLSWLSVKLYSALRLKKKKKTIDQVDQEREMENEDARRRTQ